MALIDTLFGTVEETETPEIDYSEFTFGNTVYSIGDEPRNYEEFRMKRRCGRLGKGGRGFRIVFSEDKFVDTHNLWEAWTVDPSALPVALKIEAIPAGEEKWK